MTMNRNAVLILSAALLCCLDTEAQQKTDLPSVETKRYLQLMDSAEKQVAAGDLSRALKTFQDAAEETFYESPNYEPLLKVGELQCRLGKKTLGESSLKDYRCALNLLAAKISCYIEEQDGTQRANSELSPSCFNRMCAEIFLPYERNLTPENLRILDTQLRDLERAEQVCANAK